MTDEVVVTMRDCRRAGYCSAGVRAFFKRRGLDYAGFLRDGMRVSEAELEAIGDDMARRVVQEAQNGRR